MGFFDRLRGRDDGRPGPAEISDEQAIARYRYLLRTAPPETIEQAHAEAFAQLTPEQRRQVLQQLSSVSEPGAVRQAQDDPQTLARLATRAELRQPGLLERIFGGGMRYGSPGYSAGYGSPGLGMGGIIGGSLLGSLAGSFIGTAIAQQFFDHHNVDMNLVDQGLASSHLVDSGLAPSLDGSSDTEQFMEEPQYGFDDETIDLGGDFSDNSDLDLGEDI